MIPGRTLFEEKVNERVSGSLWGRFQHRMAAWTGTPSALRHDHPITCLSPKYRPGSSMKENPEAALEGHFQCTLSLPPRAACRYGGFNHAFPCGHHQPVCGECNMPSQNMSNFICKISDCCFFPRANLQSNTFNNFCSFCSRNLGLFLEPIAP